MKLTAQEGLNGETVMEIKFPRTAKVASDIVGTVVLASIFLPPVKMAVLATSAVRTVVGLALGTSALLDAIDIVKDYRVQKKLDELDELMKKAEEAVSEKVEEGPVVDAAIPAA